LELPLHLTEKILCCVSPLESAHLATVCKSWAAIVADRLARPIPHLFVTGTVRRAQERAPSTTTATTQRQRTDLRRGAVVAVPLDGGVVVGGARDPSWRVADLVSRKGLRCVGATPSGLLAFASSSSSAVLVNPVTGDLHSGVPARTSGSGDSFFCQDAFGDLMIWRRGEGCSWWSPLPVDTHGIGVGVGDHHGRSTILSVANCDGCAYVLHEDGCVSKVDTSTTVWVRSLTRLPVASLMIDGDNDGGGDRLAKGSHLVESDGEILFVRRPPPTGRFRRPGAAASPSTSSAPSLASRCTGWTRRSGAGRRWRSSPATGRYS